MSHNECLIGIYIYMRASNAGVTGGGDFVFIAHAFLFLGLVYSSLVHQGLA